jgi:hypothetical protein
MELPTVQTLTELTELARQHRGLYVRWSRGPEADAAGNSSDDLTGVPLPGLSANPLRPAGGLGRAQHHQQAVRAIDEQNADWGPLRRPASGPANAASG